MTTPDYLLKKQGFRTQHDDRDKNIRYKCPHCVRDKLLFSSFGLHMFREHQDDIFLGDKQHHKHNRENLQKASYQKKPFIEEAESTERHWCFGCLSCFTKPATAAKHFQSRPKCQEAHKENMLVLKNKYPVDSEKKLTALKYKDKLELLVDNLVERLRFLENKHNEEKFDYEEKFGIYFEEWDMNFKENFLKESWNSTLDKVPLKSEIPESTEEIEAPPLVEDDDDILPLVQEKSLTLKEVIQQTLSETDIDEESKKFLLAASKVTERQPQPSIQKPSVPLFAKRKPKATDDQVSVRPPPAPIPAPPPEEKKDLTKEAEKLMAEMDAFKNKTPWQRFVQNHPNLSVQEQVQLAASMGIRPDAQNSRIVSNTKAAKPLRQN